MMQLKNEGERVPLITISLVIGQSVNMILISSCSISDTFEPFSIVLKCVYYFFFKEFKKKKKMARLFQELKLDFDREEQLQITHLTDLTC